MKLRNVPLHVSFPGQTNEWTNRKEGEINKRHKNNNAGKVLVSVFIFDTATCDISFHVSAVLMQVIHSSLFLSACKGDKNSN